MKRPIVDFFQDADSHWAARLSCGHAQHTRHAPPLSERPWVLTEAGRSERIGTLLDCVACDRAEMPDGFTAYQRTKPFTEATVPAALTANHTTKAGVWALIHVEEGELEYSIDDPRLPAVRQTPQRLRPGRPGVVIAEATHRVKPRGPVTFHVEFWRRIEPS